jgi:hypothetical protein
MQQRIKVLILANTRKKHKEGVTSVEDRQEERASDNSKNFLAHVHVDIPSWSNKLEGLCHECHESKVLISLDLI